MKTDRIVDLMEASGRCHSELAAFLKDAGPVHLNALRRMLRLFNRRNTDHQLDLEPYAIQGAVESMAVSLVPDDQVDSEFKKRARGLGELMSCAAFNLFAEKAPKQHFDQFVDFLSHIGQTHFGSPIDVMRRQVAAEDNKATDSLANLSGSLNAAEEAIRDVDWLQRKFDEEKGQVLLFVGGSNSVELSGDEFKATLAELRKMRGEYELEADPAAVDKVVDAFHGAVSSLRPRQKPAVAA
jgi:hypothetical protein